MKNATLIIEETQGSGLFSKRPPDANEGAGDQPTMPEAYQDLLAWIVLGAALGWWRGWKKTAASFARSMATVNASAADPQISRTTIARIKGIRFGACSVSAAVGAVLSAAIYGALMGGLWLLER